MNAGSRLAGLRASYDRWRTPRADGLPRLRVLLAFPALVAVVGAILVALSVNGSSSGVFHGQLETGTDPDLIAGTPQVIRSDEWNVQTVWAITQAEQGLPVTNESFPGGMDATIPQDLPRADWSVAFRPHLVGFLAFDVDHAIALKWWLPALALLAAVYCFAVTILPRQPMVSAGIAIGFYLSPLFHWWFLQTTLWPAAWGFVLLSTVIWCLRSSTKAPPLVWAAVLAYLTPVMAMGIYVPFIVPVVLVAALTAAGAVAAAVGGGMRWGELFARIWPVFAAGAVGAIVVLSWLLEKSATVEAFLGTAYPGERLFQTGQEGWLGLAGLLSSSFALALRAGTWLGANPSEASTFFLVGMFLLPVVIWLIVRLRRAGQRAPWMLIGASVAIVVILAFIFIPGWDAIAHVLFLDRSLPNRLRMGLGFASIVITILLVASLSKGRRPGWLLSLATAGVFLASQIGVAVYAERLAPGSTGLAHYWWALAIVSAVVVLCYARAHAAIATLGLVLVGLVTAATVNPIYRGVLDLRETEASQAIQALDDTDPDATWVGIGDRLATAMLLESGVTSLNGFQGAPSDTMWEMIDPDNAFEFEWNRLAGVSWTRGQGEPLVSNPYPDQILVTFDACSTFAQEHVDYVLADTSQPVADDPCLREVEDFPIVNGELTIFEVIPASEIVPSP